MKVCCVEGCKGPDSAKPMFFEFPSSRLLRKRWLDAIKSSTLESSLYVCVLHFARGDYEVGKGGAYLRARVVPSRRLPRGADDEDSDSESSETSESESDERTQGKGTKNKESNEKIRSAKEKSRRGIARLSKEQNENLNKDLTDKTSPDPNENSQSRLTNRKGSAENQQRDKNCNGSEQLHNESEKNQKESEIVHNKSDKVHNESDKVHNESDKVNNESDKVNNESEKVHNESDKVNNASDKVQSESKRDGKVKPVRGRRTRCKVAARRAMNGRRRRKVESSSSPDSVSSSPARRTPVPEGSKEDIEEALKHYYIENKKTERQVAAMTDVLLEDQEKRDEEARKEYEKEMEKENLQTTEQTNPVYVEMSVAPGGSTVSSEPQSDCLMVLESVQCEVDPAMLLAARYALREEEEENMERVELDDEDDDDEPVIIEKKKEDPISLLTSSDEDDVILQEPKIDTVEVSSADTSEDDMPLVKLVKPVKVKEKEILSAKKVKNLMTQLIFGKNDFYCVRCRYTTSNSSEYTKHMASHSKVLQLCHDCGFTSSSKHQMQKHKQKHKNEKRYHCRMCNYSAKHKMSLVYHMKTHNASVTEVELAICGTYDPELERSKNIAKSKDGEDKRYKCGIDACSYNTDRRSDMKRHRRRIHARGEEDSDEYVP